MDSGRRTRSGVVFSPWQTQIHRVPLDLRDLLEQAPQERLDEPEDCLSDNPPALGNTIEPPTATPAAHPSFEIHAPSMREAFPHKLNKDCAGGVGDSGGGLHVVEVEVKGGVQTNVEIPTELPCTRKPTLLNHPSSSQSERNKAYHKAKRQQRRLRAQQNSTHPYPKQIAKRHVMEARKYFIEEADLHKFRHANPGYVGVRSTEDTPAQTLHKSINDLIEDGYTYIPWDGTTGMTVVDCKGRGIVYGGSPQDQVAWFEVTSNCAEQIRKARDKCSFKPREASHRRGEFPALAYGISYGQGQPKPMRLSNSKVNHRSLQELVKDENMKRVAGFQGQLFRTFAPTLSQYYDDTLTSIEDKHELKRNFRNSDYASITINFGPRTVSVPHYDTANLAYGLCAITALGDFNPDTSGFIVLRELRMVIRFPPGSTLLILSAIVEHFNLPIAEGEQRYSVTQYSSGHLFRWVNNGFCINSERSAEADLRSTLEWQLGLEKLPVVCTSP